MSVNREILKLAIPNILSNVSVPLLSSVDTALMGFEDAPEYLAAVGLGAMVFNFIYWGFGFLRMGTTGMTAQAFGRNDSKDILSLLGKGWMVAIIISTLFLVFQMPLREICSWLVGADETTAPLIAEYFHIRIWGAPAALGLMVVMGWLFGMQNAVYPLILTLVINAVNIATSMILVNQYDMGISGVAWGTLVAQYIGLLTAIGLLLYKYKSILKNFSWQLVNQWKSYADFFRVNRDIFIRTVCLIIAFGFFFNRSAAEGVLIVAVNQVFFQFINWMSYAVDGFAYASESLVGKYVGEKNKPKERQSILWSFIWGGGFALVFSIAYALAGNSFIRIFTDQPDVISRSQDFLFWMIIYPICGFASYIWDGVFIGKTASKAMRDTMLISLVCFIAAYFIFSSWGNHGLWMALTVFVVARGALQTLWMKWI